MKPKAENNKLEIKQYPAIQGKLTKNTIDSIDAMASIMSFFRRTI
jgi:hypothetical protein